MQQIAKQQIQNQVSISSQEEEDNSQQEDQLISDEIFHLISLKLQNIAQEISPFQLETNSQIDKNINQLNTLLLSVLVQFFEIYPEQFSNSSEFFIKYYSERAQQIEHDSLFFGEILSALCNSFVCTNPSKKELQNKFQIVIDYCLKKLKVEIEVDQASIDVQDSLELGIKSLYSLQSVLTIPILDKNVVQLISQKLLQSLQIVRQLIRKQNSNQKSEQQNIAQQIQNSQQSLDFSENFEIIQEVICDVLFKLLQVYSNLKVSNQIIIDNIVLNIKEDLDQQQEQCPILILKANMYFLVHLFYSVIKPYFEYHNNQANNPKQVNSILNTFLGTALKGSSNSDSQTCSYSNAFIVLAIKTQLPGINNYINLQIIENMMKFLQNQSSQIYSQSFSVASSYKNTNVDDSYLDSQCNYSMTGEIDIIQENNSISTVLQVIKYLNDEDNSSQFIEKILLNYIELVKHKKEKLDICEVILEIWEKNQIWFSKRTYVPLIYFFDQCQGYKQDQSKGFRKFQKKNTKEQNQSIAKALEVAKYITNELCEQEQIEDINISDILTLELKKILRVKQEVILHNIAESHCGEISTPLQKSKSYNADDIFNTHFTLSASKKLDYSFDHSNRLSQQQQYQSQQQQDDLDYNLHYSKDTHLANTKEKTQSSRKSQSKSNRSQGQSCFSDDIGPNQDVKENKSCFHSCQIY